MPKSLFSRKPTRRHSEIPSTSASSRATPSQQRQFQFPTNSYPWSAHFPPFGLLSPFPRHAHALSTSPAATGELFLFGGCVVAGMPGNDLYAISTQDFSASLLQTSGDIPNPRYGHSAVLTGTILLIWGGWTDFSDRHAQSNDDSLYLLNLVSRKWTRIVVNSLRPSSRAYQTMTLVGSKLFIFGGRTASSGLNDIWAFDLNCLKSNPFWESYELAPGNEKPLPRAGHVSVATGDRIIIFGGNGGPHNLFNDTWSFNISTRKWTELQCTGSIPSPRAGHAAVLIDDVMYVFGGLASDETKLGDLTALDLSTQRWIVFQDTGPSPCGRRGHAMASDGRRVFVLGGTLSPGAQEDEAKLIHVLDTKLLIYPKPDLDAIEHSEKTTQLAQKLSVGHPTQGQPQHGIFSSSSAVTAHGAFPFQIAPSEDMGYLASPQITRDQNPSLNSLPSVPSRSTSVSGRPRRVPREGDDDEDPTEHHAKLVTPDAPSRKEIARSERGRLIELERQPSEANTERDRRIAQLTDELAMRSALLEEAEAKLALKNALLEQAETIVAEEKKRAGLELRELQAKLDESLLSRDHALEQAQSALQKASCTAEANQQSQRELTELRTELEASKSESAAFRLQLADTESGCSTSKADADTHHNQTAAGLANMDEDRVVRRLMERMQVMEAEMASLRLNEKSFDMIECRNEG